MYERIAFIKSSHVLGSCDKSRIFLIPKRREGGWGVCGKKNFLGKTRFKSYLTINQSQKLKLIFFHIFLTASLHFNKFRSIRYSHNEPVQPRLELNAADLYIPRYG